MGNDSSHLRRRDRRDNGDTECKKEEEEDYYEYSEYDDGRLKDLVREVLEEERGTGRNHSAEQNEIMHRVIDLLQQHESNVGRGRARGHEVDDMPGKLHALLDKIKMEGKNSRDRNASNDKRELLMETLIRLGAKVANQPNGSSQWGHQKQLRSKSQSSNPNQGAIKKKQPAETGGNGKNHMKQQNMPYNPNRGPFDNLHPGDFENKGSEQFHGRGCGQKQNRVRGQSENRGRGQSENRGRGQNENRGRGQNENRGRGQNENRGRGQSENRGGGKSENRGGGQSENRGRGQRENRGRGQRENRGRGQSENRGRGQSENRGGGQSENRGGGQSENRGRDHYQATGQYHEKEPEKYNNFNNVHGTFRDNNVGGFLHNDSGQKHREFHGELQYRGRGSYLNVGCEQPFQNQNNFGGDFQNQGNIPGQPNSVHTNYGPRPLFSNYRSGTVGNSEAFSAGPFPYQNNLQPTQFQRQMQFPSPSQNHHWNPRQGNDNLPGHLQKNLETAFEGQYKIQGNHITRDASFQKKLDHDIHGHYRAPVNFQPDDPGNGQGKWSLNENRESRHAGFPFHLTGGKHQGRSNDLHHWHKDNVRSSSENHSLNKSRANVQNEKETSSVEVVHNSLKGENVKEAVVYVGADNLHKKVVSKGDLDNDESTSSAYVAGVIVKKNKNKNKKKNTNNMPLKKATSLTSLKNLMEAGEKTAEETMLQNLLKPVADPIAVTTISPVTKIVAGDTNDAKPITAPARPVPEPRKLKVLPSKFNEGATQVQPIPEPRSVAGVLLVKEVGSVGSKAEGTKVPEESIVAVAADVQAVANGDITKIGAAPFQLFIGSGFKDDVVLGIDPSSEINDVMLISKVHGEIVACTPRTLGELQSFKRDHPFAEVILVKSDSG